jgi:hypothetical protein
MAHYALLNMSNVVTQVISGIDEDQGSKNWELYYQGIYTQVCKRTSYNTRGGVHANGGTPFRKNFAAKGYTYDEYKDAFIPPKPYDSWTLNTTTCLWEAPVAMPNDGNAYAWDEDNEEWDQV